MTLFTLFIILPVIILSYKLNITNQETTSDETNIFLNQYPIKQLGTVYIQKLKYKDYEVDENIAFNLSLLITNNGIISSEIEKLDGIILDKDELQKDSYNFKYIIPNTVYISTSYIPNYQRQLKTSEEDIKNKFSKEHKNQVICLYNILTPVIEKFGSTFFYYTLVKVSNYYTTSIGLSNQKLYDINNNVLIDKYETDTTKLLNKKFNNFWIVNQPFATEQFLTALTNESPAILLIFKLQLVKKRLTLKFVDEITQSNSGIEPSEINDVGIYDTMYIVAMKKGIGFLTKKTVGGFTLVTKHSDKEFISLLILNRNIGERALYIINKSEGLYIYNLENISVEYPPTSPNTRMTKLDFVQNPFTSNDFVGIMLEPKSGGDEFFIELLVKDLFIPLTNKVFLLKDNQIKLYYSPDSFHSYFYNEKDNMIYQIRRGMLNGIDYIVYSAPMPTNKIDFLTGYYMYSKFYPAIINNNEIFSFNFYVPRYQFNCTIDRYGTYELVLSKNVDSCSQNISKDLGICRLSIKYPIGVLGYKLSNGLKAVIIVAPILFTLILVTLFILCANHNNWFRENNIKVNPGIDKNDRKSLYDEVSQEVILGLEEKKSQDMSIPIHSAPNDLIDKDSTFRSDKKSEISHKNHHTQKSPSSSYSKGDIPMKIDSARIMILRNNKSSGKDN